MVRTASTQNHAMAGRLEEKRFLQIGENDHALSLQILGLIVGIQARDDATLLAEFSAVNHLTNQFVCLGMLMRLPIKTGNQELTDTMRPTTKLILQKGSASSTAGFPDVETPLLHTLGEHERTSYVPFSASLSDRIR